MKEFLPKYALTLGVASPASGEPSPFCKGTPIIIYFYTVKLN